MIHDETGATAVMDWFHFIFFGPRSAPPGLFFFFLFIDGVEEDEEEEEQKRASV